MMCIAFLASTSDAHAKELYRFYSDTYKGHFYTDSVAERDAVDRDSAWQYEGVAYSVSEAADTIPVYRFWSENYRHHFFTISKDERDTIIGNDPNWAYEGEVFTVATTGTPIHRFYSEIFKGHFYTASTAEKESLEQNDPNWTYEGIAWYAVPYAASSLPSIAELERGIAQRAQEFPSVNPSVYPGTQRIVHTIEEHLGELVLPVSAQESDHALWEIVKDLAPTDAVLESVVEFEVYYDEQAGFNASVASVGGTLENWRISINYTAAQEFDVLPSLIVHEFAHILSYGESQITSTLDDPNIAANCTTYYDGGICFNAGSYVDTLYRDFWAGITDGGQAYYNNHQTDFVSAYAAANPEEDFADTVSSVIMEEDGNPSHVSEQKKKSTQWLCGAFSLQAKGKSSNESMG